MLPVDSHRTERIFDPVPGSASAARQFVLQTVAPGFGDPGRIATLVSELVTNAILYARTPFTVSVSQNDDVVRVSVSDESTVLPVSKQYVVNQPTGRGLMIVESLSDRWGVTAEDGGKTVWFEIDQQDGNDR